MLAKRPFRAGVQPEKKILTINGTSRGFRKRVQLVDQEEFGDEKDDDYMMLNVEGGNNEAKLYYMKGVIYGSPFKTVIDTGSPVTIFALDEVKRIMKREKLPIGQMV